MTKEDPIHAAAIVRAQRIVDAFTAAASVDTPNLAMALGAAFRACADGLTEHANDVSEAKKRGHVALAKELTQVASRIVGVAQEIAELAPLCEGEFEALAQQLLADELADHALTGPLDPEVLEALEPVLSEAATRLEELNFTPSTEITGTLAGQPDQPAPDGLMDYLSGKSDTLPPMGLSDLPPDTFTLTSMPSDTFTIPVVNVADGMLHAIDPGADAIMISTNGDGEVIDAVKIEGPLTTASMSATIDQAARLEFYDNLKEMVDMGPLEFEDPRPVTEQWNKEPFPGAFQERRTYADLARPVDPANVPDHWSYSQLTGSEDCGVQHRLGRLEGVKQQPQWANVGGSTFHALTEAFDRAAMAANGADLLPPEASSKEAVRARWLQGFEAQISKVAAETGIEPGDEGQFWRAAKQGRENKTWWIVNGERMLEDYVNFRIQEDRSYREFTGSPLRVLSLPRDGQLVPVIEYEYQRPVTTPIGIVKVHGTIDRAYLVPLADSNPPLVRIRDLKTGGYGADTDQLGEYAWAIIQELSRMYPGVVRPPVIEGEFYNARQGVTTTPVLPLELHPSEEWAYRYGAAEAKRRMGLYQLRKSSFCNGCSVKHACPTAQR